MCMTDLLSSSGSRALQVKAWNTWRDHMQVQRAKRGAMLACILRLQQGITGRLFRAWHETCMQRAALRATAHACLARLQHLLLSRAFARWADFPVQQREIRLRGPSFKSLRDRVLIYPAKCCSLDLFPFSAREHHPVSKTFPKVPRQQANLVGIYQNLCASLQGADTACAGSSHAPPAQHQLRSLA